MATLKTHELTKAYGGRTVVKGVSLEVASGEIVGLLGPNGAGKTTTFYMTVGLTAPDSGRVTLDGETSPTIRCTCARAGHRLPPQEPSIFRGLTVEQTSWRSSKPAARRRRAPQRARELLAELGLTTVARRRRTRSPAESAGGPKSPARS